MFRCQLYEREINTARSSRTPEEIDGFETALVNLCACVLSFLCAAQEVCKTNAIRRTFHALWDPETIVDFEKTYLSLEKAVQTEAAANRGHVFINFKDELVTEIYPRIFGMHETVEVLKTKCDNEERVKILKWVSSIPVEDDHKDRSKHRTKGTCEWILERSEFLQWKESQSPLILWIHGIREPNSSSISRSSTYRSSFRPLKEHPKQSWPQHIDPFTPFLDCRGTCEIQLRNIVTNYNNTTQRVPARQNWSQISSMSSNSDQIQRNVRIMLISTAKKEIMSAKIQRAF